MADALTFTIELPDGKYASVNRMTRGYRDPRKSDIYKAIYAAVYDAAVAERDRIGWSIAECECLATIMRVMPARWRADASNLGKPEWDALTAAGIWTDDRLANPCLPWIRYDDEGSHRVTIVVMKLYEPANVRIVARGMEAGTGETRKRLDAEGTTARSRRDAPKQTPVSIANSSPSSGRIKYNGGSIPEGMAVVNGYLEPRDSVIAQYLGKRTA